MKKISIQTLSAMLFLVAGLTASGQGFIQPQEGNAVVYFTRVTSLGFAIPFDFFDSTAFIGQFAGKNYLRYECEPGRHLFWASSENKEFVTANLEAGGSYIVVVDVKMGIGMARVGLTPIDQNDEAYARAKQLIQKKRSAPQDPAWLLKENERLSDFIREKLQRYEEEWKNTLTIRHIRPEMRLPDDLVL